MKALLLTTALLVSISTPTFALNDNSNNNNNSPSLKQGQAQGQLQGQSQRSSNTNKNANSNANKNTAVSGSASNNANAVQNDVTVEGDSIRIPASTATAPSLVAAEDTCMGSTSVGGQGFSFGFATGTTWSDKDCVRRKDARELHNMKQPEAAIALMCQSANVQEAFAAIGKRCPTASQKEKGINIAVARNGNCDYPHSTGCRK